MAPWSGAGAPSPQVPRSDRVPTRPFQAVDPLESRPRLTNERLASSELQDRTSPPSKPELGEHSRLPMRVAVGRSRHVHNRDLMLTHTVERL